MTMKTETKSIQQQAAELKAVIEAYIKDRKNTTVTQPTGSLG